MKMHYLTYVFIPQHRDIATGVVEALRPFGCELEVDPWDRYIDETEIEAMAKHYGVSRLDLEKLAGLMEDWNGGIGVVKKDGLYARLTYNPDAKWDWYEIGGRWSGFLRNDAILARSLLRSPKLKDRLPHDYLTPDGKWHAKAEFISTGWMQGHMVHTPGGRWHKEFRSALSAWPKHRVVVVDRHC